MAEIPVAEPPIAMVVLPPDVVQTTEPVTFWFLPSMITVVEPLVLAVTPPPLDVVVLLLEHPEIPAARIAAPATAAVSPRFTCSPLPDRCGLGIEDRQGSMRVCRTAQK
jgi:hypothetical protein